MCWLVCVGGLFTGPVRWGWGLAFSPEVLVRQVNAKVSLPFRVSSLATLGEGLALTSGVPFTWIPSKDGN